MRYKKIMILTIILACLLAISAVSAAENATDDIVSADLDDDVVSVTEDNQIIMEDIGNDKFVIVDNNQTIKEKESVVINDENNQDILDEPLCNDSNEYYGTNNGILQCSDIINEQVEEILTYTSHHVSRDNYDDYFDDAGLLKSISVKKGDTIYIEGNFSQKKFTFEKIVNIIGSDSNNLENCMFTLNSAASGSTISNLNIANTINDYYGILLNGANNCLISGCKINNYGKYSYPICINNANNNNITDNILIAYGKSYGTGTRSTSPLILSGSHYNYIANNIIMADDANAIYLSSYSGGPLNGGESNFNIIYNNTIKYNVLPTSWSYGIQIMGNNNTINFNRVIGSYIGITTSGTGNIIINNRIINLTGADFSNPSVEIGGEGAIVAGGYSTIVNNTIENAKVTVASAAIYVKDNSIIENNTVEVFSEGYGINPAGSNTTIKNNFISTLSGAAILIKTDSVNFTVSNNNILSQFGVGVLLNKLSSKRYPDYVTITNNTFFVSSYEKAIDTHNVPEINIFVENNNISLLKNSTIIISSDIVHIVYGETVRFNITTNVDGKIFVRYNSFEKILKTTNRSAFIDISNLKASSSPNTVEFLFYPSSFFYSQSMNYSNVYVNQSDSYMVIDNVYADFANEIVIMANVQSDNGSINEGKVTFYLDDEFIGSAYVEDGLATLAYVPNVVGNHTITAIYKSENYTTSNSTAILSVKEPEIILNIDGIETFHYSDSILFANTTFNKEIAIVVNVTSGTGLINEGIVRFYVDDEFMDSAYVEDGLATLAYVPTVIGDHTIVAIYYCDDYISSNSTAILSVGKANVNLNINGMDSFYFSNPIEFMIDVLSDSGDVNEGDIKYYINNVFMGSSEASGYLIFSCISNATGDFNFSVVFEETDNFLAKNSSTTFSVIKMPTSLSGETVFFDEEESKTYSTTLKDDNNNGVYGQTVKIETVKYSGESKTFTGVSDSNGITIYDVDGLAGGMWIIRGIYDGNGNYIGSGFSDKFIVIRMNTSTTIADINDPHKDHPIHFHADIHDEFGNPVTDGNAHFYLDGVDLGYIDLGNHNVMPPNPNGPNLLGAKNTALNYKLEAKDNSDLYIEYTPNDVGRHTLTVVYEGTSLYKSSNQTTTFKVNDGPASCKLTSSVSTVTTLYNNGKTIVAKLTDIYGNPIKSTKLTLKIGTISKTASTNSKGQATFDVSLAVPKSSYYSATVKFAGNTKYKASTKTVKVLIKKDNTKIIASNKAFSVKAIKKVTAILKDSKNRIIKNRYVTFKVAGKSYKVRTNSKGVATATVKITKKGSFKTTATFAGDAYYNKAAIKTIKITVK